jgi:2-methylisocitrate lyase-like PEP mutase family enzyme
MDARLERAELIGTHLEDTVLLDAHLEGADLTDAFLMAQRIYTMPFFAIKSMELLLLGIYIGAMSMLP